MNRIKCIFAVLLTGLCISGCTQQVNNQSADQAMTEAVPVKTQSTDKTHNADAAQSTDITQNADKTQNTDKTVKEDRLVISSSELNVSLFYENEAEGMFRGVYLRYNGEDTYFEWKTLSTPLFPPSLFLLNSGRHLAVSLVEGEGSGLFLSELHIMDLKTREEISFELPIEFLDRNLESRLDQGSYKVKTAEFVMDENIEVGSG